MDDCTVGGVSVNVTNSGGQKAFYVVTLDGEPYGFPGEVAPGESVDALVALGIERFGTDVSVGVTADGVALGDTVITVTCNVSSQQDPCPESTDTSNQGVTADSGGWPWWLKALLALGGLALVLVILARRRRANMENEDEGLYPESSDSEGSTETTSV